jgi:hypothetical protein
MPVYNVHYPLAMTIDASTFNDAAKRFVKMNRNYNIGQLIMSDQMNKYKTAMIRNYVVNGIPKARIQLQSYAPLPRNTPTLAVQTNNFPIPLVAPGFNFVSPNVVGDPANFPFILEN